MLSVLVLFACSFLNIVLGLPQQSPFAGRRERISDKVIVVLKDELSDFQGE
jgi:hypothetical protein